MTGDNKDNSGDNQDNKNQPEAPPAPETAEATSGGEKAATGKLPGMSAGKSETTTAPPAEDKPAAGKLPGTGTNNNAKAAANSRAESLKQGLMNPRNIGGLLKKAFMAAVGIPPIIAGVMWVGDGMNFNMQAADTFWNRTTGMWSWEAGLVTGAARVVSTPLTAVIDGTATGPRATFVKYCQPELLVAAVSPEQAQRRRDDQNYLRGVVNEHLRQESSQTNRIIATGGYPMIIAEFSNPANPNSLPTIEVRNVPGPTDQDCPAGYRALTFAIR